MDPAAPPSGYRFGAFELGLDDRDLRRRGIRVRLRGRPIEILITLIEKPGELVTRDELRERLWSSDTFVDFDHNLNSAVNKLREALGDTAENPRFIETVPRRGYRWIGPVEPLVRPTLTTPAPQAVTEAIVPAHADSAAAGAIDIKEAVPAGGLLPTGIRDGRRRSLGWLLGLAAAAALAIGAVVWQGWTGRREAGPFATGPTRRVMLVVLPFQNLGPAGEADFFTDGITDEMIGQLGALDPSRLGVIARTSSMQYRGSTKTVMEIGKELGVDYVLEGSVRRDATQARITAQLVDVISQTQLWTETYERDLKDLLMLQRDVASRVARSLAGGVLSPVLARQTSPPFAAYELVLKARALRQEATEESGWKCVATFEEAIRIDPQYAPAHAGLGDCYRLLGAPGWEAGPPVELLNRARHAVDRAIALDPNLADSYATRAMVRLNLDWDPAGANDDIDRAVALNPSHARANQYRSAILTAMGRFDEAVAAAELAQKLDPLSVTESTTLGVRLYYARRFPEAIQQFGRTAQLNPRFAVLSWGLGQTYRELGRHDEAVAHLRTAVEQSNRSAYMRAWLAHALAAAGQKAEAESIRRDIEAAASRQFVSPFLFALMASGSGDRAGTIKWLQQTFDLRSGWMPLVQVEPPFAWLRSDPEFKALLARVRP